MKQSPEHSDWQKSSPNYDNDNNNGNDDRNGDDGAHDEDVKRNDTTDEVLQPQSNKSDGHALPLATLPRCQSSKHSVRTNRLVPRRFVARPSKQGWGVDDGDVAFLNDDRRFFGDNDGGVNNGGDVGDVEGLEDARDLEVDTIDTTGLMEKSNSCTQRKATRRMKESIKAPSRSTSAAAAARPCGEKKQSAKKSPSISSSSSSIP